MQISLFRYFAISLLFIASGCSPSQENRIIITGQIEGVLGMIYLQEQKTSGLVKIDSAIPDEKGMFHWSVLAGETSIYSLLSEPDERLVFIAKAGDSIRITGNMNQYPSLLQVAGNSESTLIQSFYAYSARNIREVDSLQLIIDIHQGDPGFYELTVMADSLFNQIWERQREYEKNFIREHAGTFSSLLVVNYHFGVRPVLSLKTDAEEYLRVDSGLMAAYPGNRHTLFFHQWIKQVK